MFTVKTHPFTPAALVALLLILVLAALARFTYPGAVEFKHDEATLSLLALDWLAGGEFPLTGMPSSVGVPNAPASVYVMALPYALGADALSATWFVAGLNVTGVGLLWLIVYRYFGFAPALVTGLVYALNPWVILYSRKIWAQDFHTPFLLLALFLGLYGFLEGRRWAQVLCLPVMLFALQIHFAAWVLLPLYLWLVVIGGRRVLPLALLVSVLLGALVLMPFALGIAQTVENRPDRLANVLNRSGSGLAFREEALIYTIGLAAGLGVEGEGMSLEKSTLTQELPGFSVLWLGVYGAAALIGLAASWRYGWHLAGLVWGWALLPLLAFSVSWTEVYPHYFIGSLPAYALLIGVGVAQLATVGAGRSSPLRWLGFLALALFCLLPLSQGYYWSRLIAFADTTYRRQDSFATPLRYLLEVRDTLAQERDVIVLTDGFKMQYDQEPVIWSVLLHNTAACVRALAGPEVIVYPQAAFVVLTAPNAPPALPDLLPYQNSTQERFALRAGEGEYTLRRFEGLSTAFTPNAESQFDNGAEFLGHEQLGDQVAIHWRLPGPIQHDYQFFVHFLDLNGERSSQHDGDFLPGRFWCAGDEVVVNVPLPAGTQSLRVGLYRLTPDGGFVNAQVLDEAGQPYDSAVSFPLAQTG